MSDHGKPDKPGLWRDANEKTVVACMESGDMRMRTVRGATRQNQRLPIARRMGWREQEQKKESK
jgi:hypothetical protein|nr:MAG TPA: hypothetical protein [Caudoviricetes sp.]